jgi:hypothetical protein
MMGMHPLEDFWQARFSDLCTREPTQEQRRIEAAEAKMWYCFCGQSYETELDRNIHVATVRRGRRHGPMPWEFAQSSGAVAAMCTKTGQILTAESFRIRVGGLGKPNSTVAEAYTAGMGQLMTLLTPALQRERGPSDQPDDADISFNWFTDNKAAVMGHDTHNVKGSTPQKRISCKFVDSLKVMGWAQNQAERQRVKLQSIQQKNEHGLP